MLKALRNDHPILGSLFFEIANHGTPSLITQMMREIKLNKIARVYVLFLLALRGLGSMGLVSSSGKVCCLLLGFCF